MTVQSRSSKCESFAGPWNRYVCTKEKVLNIEVNVRIISTPDTFLLLVAWCIYFVRDIIMCVIREVHCIIQYTFSGKKQHIHW